MTPEGTSKLIAHPVTVAEPALVTVYVPTLPDKASAALRLPAAYAGALNDTVLATANMTAASAVTMRVLVERGF
nr:hypothetical protein [Kibdelosporangium sp. MJ126-NF4]CTQ93586.1 hypothetical protein [Kibdelosporangium sp. MJ126-NF4]